MWPLNAFSQILVTPVPRYNVVKFLQSLKYGKSILQFSILIFLKLREFLNVLSDKKVTPLPIVNPVNPLQLLNA